jgi:hypothetical protein
LPILQQFQPNEPFQKIMNNHQERGKDGYPDGQAGTRVPVETNRNAEEQQHGAVDEDQRRVSQLHSHFHEITPVRGFSLKAVDRTIVDAEQSLTLQKGWTDRHMSCS